MKKFQRYNEIMNRLHTFKHVSVKDLSDAFLVSEETIRRDLEQLEKDGLLKRKHGGAMLLNEVDYPLAYRSSRNIDKKHNIAQKSLPLFSDVYSIMADSSSTVLELIKLLAIQEHKYKIISNSINMLYELSSTPIDFISTGGMLKPDSVTLVGSQAIKTIENYYTDVTVLSCHTLSVNGASVNGELEGFTKREMVKQGKVVILLVDSTKFTFDNDALFKFASFHEIDYLVCDSEIPEEYKEVLTKHHVTVIT
ncbi:DeoR/GlpR family DNA-binding transcription regulator [Staphylococcus chromogenes]|uniref:DeoR/GlpR family DNA-binding transcription regulator n=1 Tax=Staphylococcus chromogenes TaxID=46126 RepID=UPI000D034CA1|nr:DeoR/GlpR family DNA-binding transcription regulator [Staphylococcus chromogenes]